MYRVTTKAERPPLSERLPHIVVAAGIVAAIGASLVGLVALQERHTEIEVKNDTAAIADLRVVVHGDHASAAALAHGHTTRFRLHPHGDSSVVVEYRLGDEHCRWDGGHLTRGMRDTLSIRGCGVVSEDAQLLPLFNL